MPPEGIPRTPKTGEVNGFQPHMTEIAAQVGLKLIRSSIVPNTRPALEIAEYAREQGKFDQFHLATFKAYWEETKNIGLRSVIRDIAGRCGLDADEVDRCLDEGRYTQRVIEQSDNAHRSGIAGIPAYVIGDFLIEGVQPYEFYQRAMKKALEKHPK